MNHLRNPLRVLAALPVVAAGLFVAQSPAHAADCYRFTTADVGIYVSGTKCPNDGGPLTSVSGYVQDTKADNKCAHYGVDWFTSSGYYISTNEAKACPKGAKTYFGWNAPSGAHGNDFYAVF